MDGRSQNRKSLNGLTNITADDLQVDTLEVDTITINNITLNNGVANKFVKTDSNKKLVTITSDPVFTTGDQEISGKKTFTDRIKLKDGSYTFEIYNNNNNLYIKQGGNFKFALKSNGTFEFYSNDIETSGKITGDRLVCAGELRSSTGTINCDNDNITTTADITGAVITASTNFDGNLTGNASTVTNGVYTAGDQTIAGTKTFSSTISGSIDGNAGTVTNGVYTAGDQNIFGSKTFASPIVGHLQGQADTATILHTARNIAGQSFNGSADITIASGDLTDTANIALLNNTQTFTGTKTFRSTNDHDIEPTEISYDLVYGAGAGFSGTAPSLFHSGSQVWFRSKTNQNQTQFHFATMLSGDTSYGQTGYLRLDVHSTEGVRFNAVGKNWSSSGVPDIGFMGQTKKYLFDGGVGGNDIYIDCSAFEIAKYSSNVKQSNGITFNGNLTGNAGTVTNGVYTSGDQTIAGTKTFSTTIDGSVNGNAGSVSNGVYTIGDQTIGGVKTFSSTISGSVNGNAGTVTNGVYTSGNQTIAGTKTFSSTISGSVNGNAGTVSNGIYNNQTSQTITSADNTTLKIISTGNSTKDVLLNLETSTIKWKISVDSGTEDLKIFYDKLGGSGFQEAMKINNFGSITAQNKIFVNNNFQVGGSSDFKVTESNGNTVIGGTLTLGGNLLVGSGTDQTNYPADDSNDTVIERQGGMRFWGGKGSGIGSIYYFTGMDSNVNSLQINTGGTAKHYITSTTGVISFDNEDVETTGTLNSGTITSTGESSLKNEFGYGIKIVDGSNNVPVVFGETPDYVLNEGGTMAVCAGSSTGSRRFNIYNTNTGNAILKIGNSEGIYGWIANANEFKLYQYSTGTYALIVDTSKNFDFKSGNITTTGDLTVGDINFTNDFSITNTSSGSTHYLNLKLDGTGATFSDRHISWVSRGSGIGSQYMETGSGSSASTKYCGFYPQDMRNTNIFRTTSNTYLPYFQRGSYAEDDAGNTATSSYGLNQIFVPWGDNSGGKPVRELRIGTTLYVAQGNSARDGWSTWKFYDTTSTFTASHSCTSQTIDFKTNQTPFLNGRLVEIDPDADYKDGDGWTATIDEALPQVKFTETKASKRVLGVISYKLKGTYNPIQSIGEGCIWVCNEDGNIEVGDLLISSSHQGFASKQSDDLIRNYTVGKSTCNCTFIIGEGSATVSGNIEINTEQGFSIVVNSNNTITIGEVTLTYTGTINRLDEDSDIVLIENGTITATGNYPFHHNIGKGVQINSYIKISGTVDSCNSVMKLPCFENNGIRYSFIGCIYTGG